MPITNYQLLISLFTPTCAKATAGKIHYSLFAIRYSLFATRSPYAKAPVGSIHYLLFTVYYSLFTKKNRPEKSPSGGALKQEQTLTNGASSLDRHFARYGLTVGVEVENVETRCER